MTNGSIFNYSLFYTCNVPVHEAGYCRTMEGLKRHSEIFIKYINDHYNELQCKYRTFCHQNGYRWDWDIFQDTILKCHDAIERKGKLNDTTPQGIENYFFIAFKLNVKREGQYARNMKRDLNVTSDNINDVYEQWYNETHTTSRTKLLNDLWTDFSTLYIMRTVEDNFPQEDFYLFKLKTLCGMTYKQVQEKTQAKKVRQRVCDIKNWLKDNVRKEDVKEVFTEMYGDII